MDDCILFSSFLRLPRILNDKVGTGTLMVEAHMLSVCTRKRITGEVIEVQISLGLI